MFFALTDENFEKEVSGTKKPVLVDFWMENCPPCKLIAPILDGLAKTFEGKISFAEVNLDGALKTCQKYGINVAPTVIIFKEGKPISGFIGLRPEEEIRAWLEENLLTWEYQEYAAKNGFSLNPNKKIVETIVKSLLEREKKFGQRFCPCRRISQNPDEDKKIVCPCAFHLEELERNGYCLCRLFVNPVTHN